MLDRVKWLWNGRTHPSVGQETCETGWRRRYGETTRGASEARRSLERVVLAQAPRDETAVLASDGGGSEPVASPQADRESEINAERLRVLKIITDYERRYSHYDGFIPLVCQHLRERILG